MLEVVRSFGYLGEPLIRRRDWRLILVEVFYWLVIAIRAMVIKL